MSRKTRYRELVKLLGENEIKLTTLLDPEESVKNEVINEMMCNSQLSYDELVVLRQYAEAIVNGSTKAAEFLRDTAGEKPATNIDVTDERQSGIRQMSDDELKALIADLTKNNPTYPTPYDTRTPTNPNKTQK